NLRAGRAAELDQFAGRVDDHDHDPAALLQGQGLGGRDHGVCAGVVDDSAGAEVLHAQAPFALSSAAQIAVSVVIRRVLSAKAKLTAPGRAISSSSSPSGEKIWTLLNEELYTRPSASTLSPSGKPGVIVANSRPFSSRLPPTTSKARMWCGRRGAKEPSSWFAPLSPM